MSRTSRESGYGNGDRSKAFTSELGTFNHRPVGLRLESLPTPRLLQHLAEYSPRHAEALRALNSAGAADLRKQSLREWCASLSGEGSTLFRDSRGANDRKAGGSCRRLSGDTLLEWDPAQHPRAPKGQADGGQWVAKKGGVSGRKDWDGDAATYTLNSKSGHPQLENPPGGRWAIRRNSIGLKGGIDYEGPFFIPDGKPVPPRKKKESVTKGGSDYDVTDLLSHLSSIATEPAAIGGVVLGHHWASLWAVKDKSIQSRLSKDARTYLVGSYSGPTNPSHGNRTHGGITHPQYSKEFKKEIEKYIAMKVPANQEMSLDQMEEFMNLIEDGKGADGQTNEIIKKYNDGVKNSVVGGYKRPTREERMKRGKALSNHARYKAFLAGGLLAMGLTELLSRHVKVLEVAATTHHLRDAFDALRSGDIPLAESLLIGNADSLYLKLLETEGAGAIAALNFRLAITKLFSDPAIRAFIHALDAPDENKNKPD